MCSFRSGRFGRKLRSGVVFWHQPQRALNTHWFNPPHIVPLVEVIPGQHTLPEITERVVQLLTRIGKIAVGLKRISAVEYDS